ncbi:hypothetical protein U0070_009291 [Myodes glareolus]|uniref:Uncharacterized protein n=1 Tax=Myodes glareolus TaxID=447135 RepID=A0AAW0IRK3_MYOGA
MAKIRLRLCWLGRKQSSACCMLNFRNKPMAKLEFAINLKDDSVIWTLEAQSSAPMFSREREQKEELNCGGTQQTVIEWPACRFAHFPAVPSLHGLQGDGLQCDHCRIRQTPNHWQLERTSPLLTRRQGKQAERRKAPPPKAPTTSKQHHLLAVKCSNMCTYGGHFTFKQNMVFSMDTEEGTKTMTDIREPPQTSTYGCAYETGSALKSAHLVNGTPSDLQGDWNCGSDCTTKSNHLSLGSTGTGKIDHQRHSPYYTNQRKRWIDKKGVFQSEGKKMKQQPPYTTAAQRLHWENRCSENIVYCVLVSAPTSFLFWCYFGRREMYEFQAAAATAESGILSPTPIPFTSLGHKSLGGPRAEPSLESSGGQMLERRQIEQRPSADKSPGAPSRDRWPSSQSQQSEVLLDEILLPLLPSARTAGLGLKAGTTVIKGMHHLISMATSVTIGIKGDYRDGSDASTGGLLESKGESPAERPTCAFSQEYLREYTK